MNYQQLTNTINEFHSLSSDLLNSTEETFKANLSTFKEFCESSTAIFSIINPIADVQFDGIKYFNNVCDPSNKWTNFPKPEKREEFLKVAIDLINVDNLDAVYFLNYALYFMHSSTKDINRLISSGVNDIFGKLIKYIDLELKKLINNNTEQSSLSSITYNIGNAHGSIIGSQTNAAINNSNNLNELRDIINARVKDSEENEKLQELISMVKAITENNVPVSKGVFSRFSETLEKHSWITGSIAQALIGWLVS